jgi:hypothetical protein
VPNTCSGQPTTCACVGSACGTPGSCTGVHPGPEVDCVFGP